MTYLTDKEISDALSEIIPDGHSVMGYTRDEQIEVAKEIVRRTGKSIKINAMQIHPSPTISFGEKIFRGFVTLIVFLFVATLVIGVATVVAILLAT